MKRHLALPTVVALALAAWLVSLPLRAAEKTPQPGTIVTVAGTGKAGFSGDGGPAALAMLNDPEDQALDASGNLFIADTNNNRIRKVSPDGTITTVAGTGAPGFSGDGGPAVKARLSGPAGVLADAADNLFIADGGRVRKVDPAGIIATVAGGGHPAHGLGDGGPATAASLSYTDQLALDPDGNLYIVDENNYRIRKVDAAGIITTVAGGGHPADGRGDGGLATAARFRLPLGVVLDRAGNMWVADWVDNRVRKVGPDGTITTAAGGGNPTDGLGDGGPATAARLDAPSYLTVDAGGNLFIAENRGDRIRKVSPAGIITTVAGSGQLGHTGDGGPATAALLNSPESVTVDRAGNLFFVEGDRFNAAGSATEGKGNNLVREVIGVAVPR